MLRSGLQSSQAECPASTSQVQRSRAQVVVFCFCGPHVPSCTTCWNLEVQQVPADVERCTSLHLSWWMPQVQDHLQTLCPRLSTEALEQLQTFQLHFEAQAQTLIGSPMHFSVHSRQLGNPSSKLPQMSNVAKHGPMVL